MDLLYIKPQTYNETNFDPVRNPDRINFLRGGLIYLLDGVIYLLSDFWCGVTFFAGRRKVLRSVVRRHNFILFEKYGSTICEPLYIIFNKSFIEGTFLINIRIINKLCLLFIGFAVDRSLSPWLHWYLWAINFKRNLNVDGIILINLNKIAIFRSSSPSNWVSAILKKPVMVALNTVVCIRCRLSHLWWKMRMSALNGIGSEMGHNREPNTNSNKRCTYVRYT